MRSSASACKTCVGQSGLVDRNGSAGANRAVRSRSFEPMHGETSNGMAASKVEAVVHGRKLSTAGLGRSGHSRTAL